MELCDRNVAGQDDSEQNPSLATILEDAVAFVCEESRVLSQYEAMRPGKFVKLWSGREHTDFGKLVTEVVEHLGGPPDFYVLGTDQEPPPADSYPDSAMHEVFSVFARARASVLRADVFMAGSWALALAPGQRHLPGAPEDAALAMSKAQAAFWEHAEAAYIRLYSFWDRIGQVLDFAYFNVRKFDQNGFTAVMDRIHANAAPMDNRLRGSESWKRLRAFQCSEKEDGLKWLLQRRNLVIHSLHLHPIDEKDDGVFKSQFNHLDAAHRDKLRPRRPGEEIDILLGQLGKAADLFGDFLNVVRFSPSRKTGRWLS